jgi:hypothetical protein
MKNLLKKIQNNVFPNSGINILLFADEIKDDFNKIFNKIENQINHNNQIYI